jgi:CRISPR-associated protein Cas1
MINIMPSKRMGMYYLEYCRIAQVDEKVTYTQAKKGVTQFFSLPVANTSVILMGSGTSITQAAMRLMADNGVMLASVGGGGTPLFLASQSEYRENKYFFSYLKKWQDSKHRMQMARYFQQYRMNFVQQQWKRLGIAKENDILNANLYFENRLPKAHDIKSLMGYEGNYAKRLYALLVAELGIRDFVRNPRKKDETDLFNSYLDHANYLAYGLAAVVLWVLGLPFQLAVSHGETRRGALVFDVADIIKDGIIMPVTMKAASENLSRAKMRKRCIHELHKSNALDYLFAQLIQVLDEKY